MSKANNLANPILAFKELTTTVAIVSNISRNLTKKHLIEIFSFYGPMKGVYIPKDEESKVQKNYAYLEYTNKEDAEKALFYMGDAQIDGLKVKVEILNPPEEEPEKEGNNLNTYERNPPIQARRRSRSRSRSRSNRRSNYPDRDRSNRRTYSKYSNLHSHSRHYYRSRSNDRRRNKRREDESSSSSSQSSGADSDSNSSKD